MKGCTSWNYTPYRPPLFDVGAVYICRLAPSLTGVTADWLPAAGAPYTVTVRPLASETAVCRRRVEDCTVTLSGLEPETEYVLSVETEDGRCSRLRRFRTGAAEGTVVNYLHPEDGCYGFSGSCLCSPSLVRHPDGYLLAGMDVFGHGTPQNLTLLFRSDDDGRSWRYVTELMPCFWARLFIHRGVLYVLACSTEYGDLLIGRSEDGGETFGQPTVLLRGSCKTGCPGPHKNPQPLVEHHGRLWGTLEWGSWEAMGTHGAMMMSAPADSDLLDAANWRFTEPVLYDPRWPGTAPGNSAGVLEGCPVVGPDDRLYTVMRYQMERCTPNYGRVLVFSVDEAHPEAPLQFFRAVEFPGNHAKFVIRRDTVTGWYYTIVCRIRDSACAGDRNLCSLLKSPDLFHWQLAADLIDHTAEDPRQVGFQYADWIVEGEDILFLSRTAQNGAKSYHDTNYSTFHRVSRFREW